MGRVQETWSSSVESLLAEKSGDLQCDVLVVGSGYGGAFAALELANKSRSVWVVERGKEFRAGDFPESLGKTPKFVQYQSTDRPQTVGYPDGLFDIRRGKDGAALIGCGLGGGSLINANVVLAPDQEVFEDRRWPASLMTARGGNSKAPLLEEMAFVRQILDVATFPEADQYRKSKALKQLSLAIPKTSWKPAPIAVTTRTGLNSVGVAQNACTACGNCVTGCNIGAKNTLTMNAIPLAIERGAKFFTGGKVVQVIRSQHRDRRWIVRFTRTDDRKRLEHQETFEIYADTVILAAGTFGSTEILLKSQSSTLRFSDQLGKRLSGNADFLAFGFGQRAQVRAAALMGLDRAEPMTARVGPTILGIVQSDGEHSPLPKHALIEDGVIPSSITGLISSMFAIQALPKRYTKRHPPAFFQDRKELDPNGESIEALSHTQVLLGMGIDNGDGEISLSNEGDASLTESNLQFSLGTTVNDETTAAIHNSLRSAEKGRWWGPSNGFDGGYYLPNPMYRLLPEEAEAVINATYSGKVTVHPLGGCVMADERRAGVVDQYGTVFDGLGGEGNSVHVGLHVLDGSVVPMPLGANPLLTISALSVRAARKINQTLRKTYVSDPAMSVSSALDLTGHAPIETEDWKRNHKIKFSEQLVSRFAKGAKIPSAWTQFLGDGDSSLGVLRRSMLAKGQADLALEVSASCDVVSWLANPSTAWVGTVSLYFVAKDRQPEHNEEADTPLNEVNSTPGTSHADAPLNSPIATGDIKMSLLALDEPVGLLSRVDRLWRALKQFRSSRKHSGGILRGIFSIAPRPAGQSDERTGAWAALCRLANLKKHVTNAKFFWRTAYLHTNWRNLKYEGEFTQAAVSTATFKGQKRLAYAVGEKNPWTALLELDTVLELSVDNGRDQQARTTDSWPITFHVDVLELLRHGAYQLGQTVHTPQTIANLISVAGLWVRNIGSTHYWSLRGRDYGKSLEIPRHGENLSSLVLTDGTTVDPVPHLIVVPKTAGQSANLSEESIEIRVSQYRPVKPTDARPLLLIHGLAHGGEVFTTDTVDINLASFFVGQGREVWVLDHRLSNFLGDLPRQSSSIDDIAVHDIPGALSAIASHYAGRSPGAKVTLDVFAHCVGSAAFSMSILGGYVDRLSNIGFQIGHVALHAVHPWVIPSLSNRVSAAVAAVYRDFLPGVVLDPIPSAEANGMEELLDRLAASIPWPDEKDASHFDDDEPTAFGTTICNRMTAFYGREWVHENLDPRTHRNLHRLVGPAHIDVFRHLFFLILRQRLTNRDGTNVYLTEENISRYWSYPTLFATGLKNQVFDPSSAAQSFLIANKLINDSRQHPLPIRMFSPADVGHMDFLFGKNASLERDQSKPGSGVYPALNQFLSDPQSFFNCKATNKEASVAGPNLNFIDGVPVLPIDEEFAKSISPIHTIEKTPLCGPIIDYEVDRSRTPAQVNFRIWYELRSYASGAVDRQLTHLVNHGIGRVQFLSDEIESNEQVSPLPGIYIVQHLCMTAEELHARLAKQEMSIQTLVLLSTDQKWMGATSTGAVELTDFSVTDNATPRGPGWSGIPLEDLDEIRKASNCVVCEANLDQPWVNHLASTLSASDAENTPAKFLVGSCRWPGLVVELEDRNKLFEAMRVTGRDEEVDAVWFLGDQIYADATAGLAETTETGERAAQRYRDAFTADTRLEEVYRSSDMRGLLSELPVWMVIDDHEYIDNWPGGSNAQLTTLSMQDFKMRFAAFYAYQWRSFSPAQSNGQQAVGNPELELGTTRVTRGFWREFCCAGRPCFALDTRSEREVRSIDNWRDAKLISDDQFEALQAWIDRHKHTEGPKFLLSGSPIGLVSKRLASDPSRGISEDDWNGYPASQVRLAQILLSTQMAGLYIVTGDPHLSSVTRLNISSCAVGPRVFQKPAVVHVITCSGLNASLPFANSGADRFVEEGFVPGLGGSIMISSETEILSTAAKQFGVITVEPRFGEDDAGVNFCVYDDRSRLCQFDVTKFVHRTNDTSASQAGERASAIEELVNPAQ